MVGRDSWRVLVEVVCTFNTAEQGKEKRTRKKGKINMNVDILTGNRKADPGWTSYLKMGAFYTNLSTWYDITTPDFLISPVNLGLSF